jgi:ATP phosphoribosyltransferase regulatory subunit
MYGAAGAEADVEMLELLCQALALAGARNARVDIGHVAVFRGIAHAAKASAELEAELFEALQRKDLPALRSLTKRFDSQEQKALLLLPTLYGDVKMLDEAEAKLPKIAAVTRALATLRKLAKATRYPVSFDLAELRGYHYHSGVVFDAYCDGVSGAVARGGRYDEVGKAFGRARPATGFSIDLRSLSSIEKIR